MTFTWSCQGSSRIRSATEVEPPHRRFLGVHQDPFDELCSRHLGAGFESTQLVEIDQHLGQHDVASAGQVRLDHRQGGRPDQRAGSAEVLLPTTDQGPEHIDVTVQGARMLLDVAPRQRGLADPGWPVQVDEAAHNQRL